MNASARIPDVSHGYRPTRDAASIPPPSQAEQVAQLAAEIDNRLWALASVTPCSEATTARHLRLHGLTAFQPTRTHMRRKSRYVAGLVPVERMALPGYLLVGLDDGAPEWHRLFGAPHVRGIIGSPRTAQALGRVIAEWCAGLSDRAEAFVAPAPTVAIGDSVTVMAGWLGRLPGRIVALNGRQATVLADFLGAPREVVADLGAVRVGGEA